MSRMFHIPISLEDRKFEIEGVVETFPQVGGWFYVRVPRECTELTKMLADRGLVAIVATVGNSSWKTSLLPYGNGTQFIALNAKVRKMERIKLGDKISVSFKLRER